MSESKRDGNEDKPNEQEQIERIVEKTTLKYNNNRRMNSKVNRQDI